MAPTPEQDGGNPKPRKRFRRFGGWLAMQVFVILIRHYLTSWWDDNGPTC